MRQSSRQNELAKAHPLKSDPSKTVKFVMSRGDTVRGALHKETFYGCIAKPENGEKAYVVRKPIEGPIAAIEQLVPKIVDPAIRDIVRSTIENFKREGITKLEPGMIRMPSGVPINKVRIFAHTTNPMALRGHATASRHDYKTPYYVTASEG
jgi:CRISPR-associated endonuclease Csn1